MDLRKLRAEQNHSRSAPAECQACQQLEKLQVEMSF